MPLKLKRSKRAGSRPTGHRSGGRAEQKQTDEILGVTEIEVTFKFKTAHLKCQKAAGTHKKFWEEAQSNKRSDSG